MDHHLKNSISGPSRILSVDLPSSVASAWGISLGADSYRASSDASLFSSSLPVLPHENLNFIGSEHSGQFSDDSCPSLNKLHHEDDDKNLLDDIEPNAVGSLLPGDEDELLAGIMEDFDLSGLPTQVEDLEDDLFGSGGGMEMDFENQDGLVLGLSNLSVSDGAPGTGIGHYGLPNGTGAVAGEHPYGEHPSRTLFVRNINSNVEDTELRSLFEQYGDIRTLYTACKHRGFVMISYYDIRAARTAMRALQNKPLRRRKLDIHFSIPKDNPSEKDVNQGTLVVFNLDASVSNDDLRQIFGAYGEVKEIRETPYKRHHKFIEFYDVRAAEAALKALNRSDIAGKRIKLEPSRPGGARRSLMQQLSLELEQDDALTFRHPVGSPVTNSPPGAWPHFSSPVEHNPSQGFSQSPSLGTLSPMSSNHLPGLASILPSHGSNPVKIAPIGKDLGRATQGNQVPSLGESNSQSSSVGTLSGPQFLWGSPSPYSERSNSSAWLASSGGLPFASGRHGQGYLYAGQRSSFRHQHHVGSAPSGVPLDRHFNFFSDSPDTSHVSPVSFSGVGLGRTTGNYVMNIDTRGAMNLGFALPGHLAESGSPSSRVMPFPRNGPVFFGNGYQGTTAVNTDGLTDRGRSRRVEYGGNQIENKKQYQLDIDKIRSGEDTRTTLMIKNIPNKYTSKMLLAAIDENHRGTYDFLYLPIDFKNKCNVGYAFINMVSPSHIVSFHEAFNGKKWEKFNSEKVASLAYARIQGKTALVTHFQNSSLMNEDKRCRPILFQSEGQDNSDQEPFPSNNLNICIRQPDGSYSGDSLESPRSNLDVNPENN